MFTCKQKRGIIFVKGCGNMTKAYEQRKKSNEKYLATLDEIKVRVPKGEKEIIKIYAESKGESLNSFICRLIREEMHKNN